MLPRNELTQSSLFSCTVCQALCLVALWVNHASSLQAASPSDAETASTKTFQNRLGAEASPYLLQHAHHPVNWYPWGEEAFSKARSEGKMIFLSIGYSTCHWCHVMAHESFENERIAKVMNDHFISIKVDREERPDVDAIYMNFVQASTGHGGWPMSVWLTPELKPVVGGTYFPPESRKGQPGFAEVCLQVSQAWKENPEQLMQSSQRILEYLREASHVTPAREGLSRERHTHAMRQGLDRFSEQFDDVFKGFGPAPKFPRPSVLSFLLRSFHSQGAMPEDPLKGGRELEMVLQTLDAMSRGGIHDHLAGGFHRYAVDRQWHVPHFEKMLYDQAQLAVVYSEAFQITHQPRYARVLVGILDYVLRDMTSAEGGFYSAEDADSLVSPDSPEAQEGAFYLWEDGQIDRALPESAQWFKRFYGVEALGNAPIGSDPRNELRGKNILIQRLNIEALAKEAGMTPDAADALMAKARARLKAFRDQRPRPMLDGKIIAGWNGLMISGMVRGGRCLDDGEPYIKAASHAAEFLSQEIYDPVSGILHRIHRNDRSTTEGFLDDYVYLICGLLDLYETTFQRRWLQWAEKLQNRQDERFLDSADGGYFTAAGDSSDVLMRLKEHVDGALPSPNAVAADNLLRLHQLTGKSLYEQGLNALMQCFAAVLEAQPTTVPNLLSAIDASFHSKRQFVFAAQTDDPLLKKMCQALHQPFIPYKTILLMDEPGRSFLKGHRREALRHMIPIDQKATAYVCEDGWCRKPTNQLSEFVQLLHP